MGKQILFTESRAAGASGVLSVLSSAVDTEPLLSLLSNVMLR